MIYESERHSPKGCANTLCPITNYFEFFGLQNILHIFNSECFFIIDVWAFLNVDCSMSNVWLLSIVWIDWICIINCLIDLFVVYKLDRFFQFDFMKILVWMFLIVLYFVKLIYWKFCAIFSGNFFIKKIHCYKHKLDSNEINKNIKFECKY